MTLRFWWSWPSWLTELVSGFGLTACVALAVFVCHHWPTFLVRLAVVTLFSLVYESLVDGNGWSLKDALHREIGLVLAVILWGNLL